MTQIFTNIIDSYILKKTNKTGRQDDKKNHIISQLIYLPQLLIYLPQLLIYLPQMTQIFTNIIDSCILCSHTIINFRLTYLPQLLIYLPQMTQISTNIID